MRQPGGRRRLALLLVVVGPAAWLGHLLVSYGLLYVSCAVGTSLPLHVTTVLAVGAVAAGLVIGRRADHLPLSELASTDRPPGFDADQFAADAGRWLSYYFLVVVVMAGLAALVVGPCL